MNINTLRIDNPVPRSMMIPIILIHSRLQSYSCRLVWGSQLLGVSMTQSEGHKTLAGLDDLYPVKHTGS